MAEQQGKEPPQSEDEAELKTFDFETLPLPTDETLRQDMANWSKRRVLRVYPVTMHDIIRLQPLVADAKHCVIRVGRSNSGVSSSPGLLVLFFSQPKDAEAAQIKLKADVNEEEIKVDLMNDDKDFLLPQDIEGFHWINLNTTLQDHGKIVYVGNLPKGASEASLSEFFPSAVIRIASDNNDTPVGYAYVFYETDDEAEKSVQLTCKASVLDGHQLAIEQLSKLTCDLTPAQVVSLKKRKVIVEAALSVIDDKKKEVAIELKKKLNIVNGKLQRHILSKPKLKCTNESPTDATPMDSTPIDARSTADTPTDMEVGEPVDEGSTPTERHNTSIAQNTQSTDDSTLRNRTSANSTPKTNAKGVTPTRANRASTNKTPTDSANRASTNKTPTDSAKRASTNKTPTDSANRASTNKTPTDSAKRASTNKTPTDSANKASTNKTPMDSAKRASTNKTPTDSAKRASTNKTPTYSANRESTNKTPMDSANRASTNKTPMDSANRASTNKTPTDSAKRASTNKTPTDSANRESTNKTPMDSANRASTNKTPTDSAKRASTNKTPTDSANKASTNKTPTDSAKRASTNKTPTDSAKRASTNKTPMDRNSTSSWPRGDSKTSPSGPASRKMQQKRTHQGGSVSERPTSQRPVVSNESDRPTENRSVSTDHSDRETNDAIRNIQEKYRVKSIEDRPISQGGVSKGQVSDRSPSKRSTPHDRRDAQRSDDTRPVTSTPNSRQQARGNSAPNVTKGTPPANSKGTALLAQIMQRNKAKMSAQRQVATPQSVMSSPFVSPVQALYQSPQFDGMPGQVPLYQQGPQMAGQQQFSGFTPKRAHSNSFSDSEGYKRMRADPMVGPMEQQQHAMRVLAGLNQVFSQEGHGRGNVFPN